MLVDRLPFDNNDVRLALKYAVNRGLTGICSGCVLSGVTSV
jgi:hypothetical protein